MGDNRAAVRKVRAFPFAVEFRGESAPTPAAPFKGQVVKMTPIGFLAETTQTQINAGDKLHFAFELPALHHLIEGEGVVVKLYNHFTLTAPGQPAGPTLRLLEVHFRLLSLDHQQHVTEFLKKAMKSAS